MHRRSTTTVLLHHLSIAQVGINSINVTDYTEYAAKDAGTLAAFKQAGMGDPIGSMETTDGVIRVQSEAPFIFVIGVPNRFGKFDDDVDPNAAAQNFAAAFNGGIVVAALMPYLDLLAGEGDLQMHQTSKCPHT